MKVQGTYNGLKMNGAYQLLVYGNLLDTRKNTTVTNKNANLQINADKTEYTFMSCQQNI